MAVKKRLIGNLVLVGLLVTLALSYIDFGQKSLSYEGYISDYIRQNLAPETEYTPLSFDKVDEDYLLSQEDVTASLALIADTIGRQLNLLKGLFISTEFQGSLEKANDYLAQMDLGNVKRYLNIDAELKRHIKRAGGLDHPTRSALHEQEVKLLDAINELNASLGRYNLSIFSIDFSEINTVHYLHRYKLKDRFGTSIAQTMFELDIDSKEIVSFKDIESAENG